LCEASPERASPERGKAGARPPNIPRTRYGVYALRVEIETSPPQPEEVADAIRDALAEQPRRPDPWWQAGVHESLGE